MVLKCPPHSQGSFSGCFCRAYPKGIICATTNERREASSVRLSCSCWLRAQQRVQRIWQRIEHLSLCRDLTSTLLQGYSNPLKPSVGTGPGTAGLQHRARGCTGGERDGVRHRGLSRPSPRLCPLLASASSPPSSILTWQEEKW